MLAVFPVWYNVVLVAYFIHNCLCLLTSFPLMSLPLVFPNC